MKELIGNIRGKSAFDHARDAGYRGTEAQFAALLAAVPETVVGGSVLGGRLQLTTASGQSFDAGEVKGADGANVLPTAQAIAAEFERPSSPVRAAVDIAVQNAVGEAVDELDVSKGPIHVSRWNGTTWVDLVPHAGAIIRLFEAGAYTNATRYTGPTFPGVTDYYSETPRAAAAPMTLRVVEPAALTSTPTDTAGETE